MTALTHQDIAQILRGYTKDIAEANAYILAAILSETEKGDVIVDKLEALLTSPELEEVPVTRDYLRLVVSALNLG